ncbi:MAG TPA: DUF2249 domain-containing protein [Bryobacteraceae bacterium]|nr:DUF2249 domain-containing protein [Bryobacteraceae bacterium]
MENHNEELDLREVERFRRHPLVFAKFDALKVGESFVLINDHDPVPLHGQMDAMRPQQLTWEYLVRGPGTFRIQVTRIAPLTGDEKPLNAAPQAVMGIKQSQ